MLRSTDWFVAAGQVDGAAGALTGRGCVAAKIGVGHYSLTLDQAVDVTERSVQCTVHEVAPLAGVSVHEISDTVIHVHTFTGAAAADHDFDFLIVRFAP